MTAPPEPSQPDESAANQGQQAQPPTKTPEPEQSQQHDPPPEEKVDPEKAEEEEREDEPPGVADTVGRNPTLRAFVQVGRSHPIREMANYGPSIIGDFGVAIGAVNLGQGDPVRFHAEAVLELPMRLSTFVRPAGFKVLDGRLREHRVISLAGPPESGRMSAACAALARRYGPERVMEILLPKDADPADIREQPDLLTKGCGYVIRLGLDTPAGLIRTLTATFERYEAGAVVIREADAPEARPHHAEVFHQSPGSPARMFVRHLAYRLRQRCIDKCTTCQRRCGARYIWRLVTGDEVRSAIDLLTRPRECARYAERFADELPRDADAITALLPSGHERRRELARTILLLGPDTNDKYPSRTLQHRRGTRLAYAVLADHSLAHVTEAARLLLEKLDTLFAQPFIGRPALVHDLPELLGNVAGNWTTSRAAVLSRTAQVDPPMVAAILDVGWSDFDNSRSALIEWVEALATHPGRALEESAAVAAAVFAYHDFDLVHQLLIGRWARNRQSKLRRSAAATMVAAANLPETLLLGIAASRWIGPRVDDELRRLAWSGSAYERDTAAQAWSIGFRPRHPRQAFRDLTLVAAKNGAGYLGWNVAEATAKLSRHFGPAWGIAVLRQWADSSESSLLTSTSLAFLRMAAPRASEPPGLPELVQLMVARPEMVEQIAVLWHLILLDSAHSVRAWRMLADWLRSVRSDEQAKAVVKAMLGDLAADPAIDRRLRYWLSRAESAT